MLKKLIKLIPGTTLLNKFLLDKRIQGQFLSLTELEQSQLAFYTQFIKKGDLVFDVGANVGSRSKLFLNLGANVVAFEPQPELCEHLTQHLKKHPRFNLMPIGLGSKSTVVELKISDAHVLSSMSSRWIESTRKSGRFSSYSWNKSIGVKIDTLDSMINKFGIPKFIKIDVEGYELEVLQGLTHTVEYLSFEFTSEDIDASINCINRLDKIGQYLFKYSIGESLSFEMQEWEPLKNFKSILLKLINNDNRAWGDIYAINKPIS